MEIKCEKCGKEIDSVRYVIDGLCWNCHLSKAQSKREEFKKLGLLFE